jgi:hypothetical protein
MHILHSLSVSVMFHFENNATYWYKISREEAILLQSYNMTFWLWIPWRNGNMFHTLCRFCKIAYSCACCWKQFILSMFIIIYWVPYSLPLPCHRNLDLLKTESLSVLFSESFGPWRSDSLHRVTSNLENYGIIYMVPCLIARHS